MDNTDHRLNELEKDGDFDRAEAKKYFERMTAELAQTCGTLREYEVKLDNLWQWKLYQNGMLADIRNDIKKIKDEQRKMVLQIGEEQKQVAATLNMLWLKIVGGVVGAFIINFFITR